MEVIPSLNCGTPECIAKKIALAKKIGAAWGHLDVGDGVFSSVTLWNTEERVEALREKALADAPPLAIEAHLMVEDPERWVPVWIEAGVQRLIVHAEATKDIAKVQKECAARGVELGVSMLFSTAPERVEPFLKAGIEFVHVLAVPPGPSGQDFNEEAIAKIEWLNKRYPSVLIEMDGGVDKETGKRAKDAGADILVSGSHIFEAEEPSIAYKELRKV